MHPFPTADAAATTPTTPSSPSTPGILVLFHQLGAKTLEAVGGVQVLIESNLV
jgi:hypothetical protein